MLGPEDVLKFWLDEVKPQQWYIASDELDAQIKERFEATWNEAMNGGLGQWLTYASGSLAYVILTDQFSRNMFRDEGKSFSSDRRALAATKSAINHKWDTRIDEPARMFFYMPLMHSENLCDQERCVRLIKERITQNGENQLLHARAHREVIRLYGRFPTRNAALERRNRKDETAYLEAGGYGEIVRQFTAKAA